MKIRFPPRRVLVGVDLSEPSLRALSAALALAGRFKARLSVEYVQPPPMPDVSGGLEPLAPVAQDDSSSVRADWKRKVAALCAGATPAAKLSIETGVPEAVLARRATARSADLVVLGTHGRRGGERLFLGSVAESVVHRARVPVLSVRAGTPLSFRRVLAPCHMHRYADEALYYAMKFADAVGGHVTVLYVPPPGDWEVDAEQTLRLHLEETFGTHAARALKIVVRQGEPREQILAEARSGRYDLVALSAHRRGSLSDLALGTTAERLVRRCALPILAVPAPPRSAAVTRAQPALRPNLLPPSP